ncbi:hypothetical protein FHX81_7944 [Saccharothrix saharensis]|uniref:Resolvase-like protein n=1 Tax=Saccharothrix saharensis TaxID=571190 RepID=A0A543JRI6_9PSEU|nr:hypothetical protein FHX81_7944 [Saccharothrix saharensis]
MSTVHRSRIRPPGTGNSDRAELPAALRDPDRGFDAIIVGEYERAFAGDQLPRLLALFRRYGVQVWLPEAGGRLEPDSAKHQALIDMLEAQSLREVARARHRAMASMRVQTLEGRFPGGRAPYGYRLVESGAHPRLADARRGRMTYRLEIDPETAPVVRWLFAELSFGDVLEDEVVGEAGGVVTGVAEGDAGADVSVLDSSGDQSAWSADDEPGQDATQAARVDGGLARVWRG